MEENFLQLKSVLLASREEKDIYNPEPYKVCLKNNTTILNFVIY